MAGGEQPAAHLDVDTAIHRGGRPGFQKKVNVITSMPPEANHPFSRTA